MDPLFTYTYIENLGYTLSVRIMDRVYSRAISENDFRSSYIDLCDLGNILSHMYIDKHVSTNCILSENDEKSEIVIKIDVMITNFSTRKRQIAEYFTIPVSREKKGKDEQNRNISKRTNIDPNHVEILKTGNSTRKSVVSIESETLAKKRKIINKNEMKKTQSKHPISPICVLDDCDSKDNANLTDHVDYVEYVGTQKARNDKYPISFIHILDDSDTDSQDGFFGANLTDHVDDVEYVGSQKARNDKYPISSIHILDDTDSQDGFFGANLTDHVDSVRLQNECKIKNTGLTTFSKISPSDDCNSENESTTARFNGTITKRVTFNESENTIMYYNLDWTEKQEKIHHSQINKEMLRIYKTMTREQLIE